LHLDTEPHSAGEEEEEEEEEGREDDDVMDSKETLFLN